MGQKRKRRRRPWLARAILKAAIAIITPAGGVIAAYLYRTLKPYAFWVWVGFILLAILAFLYEFMTARMPEDSADDPSICVSGSDFGNMLIISGSNVQYHYHYHVTMGGGDFVGGDKISET